MQPQTSPFRGFTASSPILSLGSIILRWSLEPNGTHLDSFYLSVDSNESHAKRQVNISDVRNGIHIIDNLSPDTQYRVCVMNASDIEIECRTIDTVASWVSALVVSAIGVLVAIVLISLLVACFSCGSSSSKLNGNRKRINHEIVDRGTTRSKRGHEPSAKSSRDTRNRWLIASKKSFLSSTDSMGNRPGLEDDSLYMEDTFIGELDDDDDDYDYVFDEEDTEVSGKANGMSMGTHGSGVSSVRQSSVSSVLDERSFSNQTTPVAGSVAVSTQYAQRKIGRRLSKHGKSNFQISREQLPQSSLSLSHPQEFSDNELRHLSQESRRAFLEGKTPGDGQEDETRSEVQETNMDSFDDAFKHSMTNRHIILQRNSSLDQSRRPIDAIHVSLQHYQLTTLKSRLKEGQIPRPLHSTNSSSDIQPCTSESGHEIASPQCLDESQKTSSASLADGKSPTKTSVGLLSKSTILDRLSVGQQDGRKTFELALYTDIKEVI
ncbi:hypothetical protein Ciccas_001185 [Cichlidogyrus casuarinus]|uniref:Fibronectin type-III domain-containing protein n=1 Tax=Cichlidogyrus casuarinus TaxID=1844966 RepID=A0ABD2QKT1_9PLAT